ncbi:hypothetical protein [Burkholderia sp. IMCC1007]|uniref:hypothetical protein n=1 Tax=Burkholderia sp. IMCC1007 TaxID=3004104 RepID=UPI0022B332B3|nr:hypothetical protein [Burkholderia sp. IMCC1007]
MMTDTERDMLYTDLCRTMTRIGETDASLLLARFALLAIETIGDVATVTRLIDEAGHGLPAPTEPAPAPGR